MLAVYVTWRPYGLRALVALVALVALGGAR